LARDAGVPEAQLLWFEMGALLHDVGKVEVPEEILNKTDRLTASEWDVMREHPAAGERLVAGAHFPLQVMPMIRHHHERWDGAGYPDRLVGEEIPLWARLLSIADVYDALTTTRSYRTAFSVAEAATIMKGESGRAFDPNLLERFLAEVLPASEALGRPVTAGDWKPTLRATVAA
jgi:HD-GYP domain-containing protein (c-di-GMP phosphodiesterase class II)